MADAYAPRPAVQWAADGVLPLGSLSIWYGAPGTLKTMALIDLAACIVAGRPWLIDDQGRGGFPVARGPVVLLDFDNGDRTMAARLEAAGRARGLAETDPLYYVSLPSPWYDGSNNRFTDALIHDLQQLAPVVVVLDNLGAVLGKSDENAADMGAIMHNLRRLSEDTGSAVCVVHHQRKGTPGKNGTRAGDSLRGHSSIEAAIDLALLIAREPNTDDITATATKTRGAPVEDFAATFTYTVKTGTRELDRFTFVGRQVDDLSSNAAIKRTISFVVTKTPGITKTNLVDSVCNILPDVTRNRVRSQLDAMARAALLVIRTGPHNAQEYHPLDPLDAAML